MHYHFLREVLCWSSGWTFPRRCEHSYFSRQQHQSIPRRPFSPACVYIVKMEWTGGARPPARAPSLSLSSFFPPYFFLFVSFSASLSFGSHTHTLPLVMIIRLRSSWSWSLDTADTRIIIYYSVLTRPARSRSRPPLLWFAKESVPFHDSRIDSSFDLNLYRNYV